MKTQTAPSARSWNWKTLATGFALTALALTSPPADAQVEARTRPRAELPPDAPPVSATQQLDADAGTPQEQLGALKQRVQQLERQMETPSEESDEITRLKLELQLPEELTNGFTALGPAESKVYQSRSPLTLGGIGEVHYSSRGSDDRTTNVVRVNPILGYRFSRSLVFNSSFSFQNGGTPGPGGATQVEFAYIDFLFSEHEGIRVGNILVPIGLTNVQPDPVFYPMVNRPRPETLIIPSTWNENGILGFSDIGGLKIQLGAVNSGNITNATDDSWIAGGRQRGASARADDAAIFVRLDSKHANKPDIIQDTSSVGASFYSGKWAQNGNTVGDADVILAELHGTFRLGRFSGKALYVEGRLSGTDQIFAATNQVLGKAVRGGYAILSYDLLRPLARPIPPGPSETPVARQYRALPIFLSWEHTNLQAELSEGLQANDALRTNIYTVGINYKPHPQVALKLDWANEFDGNKRRTRTLESAISFAF